MWPTIMAHELSHYLYDLRDEYNNGSACQNVTPKHPLSTAALSCRSSK